MENTTYKPEVSSLKYAVVRYVEAAHAWITAAAFAAEVDAMLYEKMATDAGQAVRIVEMEG